jgi:serine protease inhibitor
MTSAASYIAIVSVAALALAGCGGSDFAGNSSDSGSTSFSSGNPLPSAVAQAQQSATPVDPQIVASDDAFGLSLLNTLTAGTASNIAISPLSVAMTLQILYNGAAGSTQQGMAQALQLAGLSAATINTDNAALQAALIDVDPNVQLTLANSLWVHPDTSILPSFTQIDTTYYGATVGDLDNAPADINAWVSTATQGLITNILPSSFNPAVETAVLANALYFKGAWTSPFNPAQTSTATFTTVSGSQVQCQMMQQTAAFPYYHGTNFQMLSLPYGEQSRLSMLIVMPDSGVDLASFTSAMTSDQLNAWIGQLSTANGSVALPRFTANFQQSLVAALTTLGMGVAFNPDAASFPDLASTATYVSDVEHATYVQVNESGTVAAAATTVTVAPTVVVEPSFSITINHPFFYAIRDSQTGLLLFVGMMTDPQS